MSEAIYDIPVDRIDGSPATLAEHRGNVMLLVNVASKCGLTPQYEGLEKLYETYRDRGLKVLGFPANDFLQQEPGSNEEIQAFCTANFGVQFPMYSKISVLGPGKHPLYAYLTEAIPVADGREEMEAKLRSSNFDFTPRPEIIWNFEKFLVSRSGEVVRRFVPDIEPDAAEVVEAIEAELARTQE
jgi:glutathione peroxidase